MEIQQRMQDEKRDGYRFIMERDHHAAVAPLIINSVILSCLTMFLLADTFLFLLTTPRALLEAHLLVTSVGLLLLCAGGRWIYHLVTRQLLAQDPLLVI